MGNPIVVRDCGPTLGLWDDTWALDFDREVIAFVNGEDRAGILAALFDPMNDRMQLLDLVILLMRTGNELAMDYQRLYKDFNRAKGE